MLRLYIGRAQKLLLVLVGSGHSASLSSHPKLLLHGLLLFGEVSLWVDLLLL
jgi:hypothetical protein